MKEPGITETESVARRAKSLGTVTCNIDWQSVSFGTELEATRERSELR